MPTTRRVSSKISYIMRHSWTVDFRSSAVSQAAALSRAIRDGNFHTLPDLLLEGTTSSSTTTLLCPDDVSDGPPGSSPPTSPSSMGGNVWWEANSRGWTAVHVAAASSASMSVFWWRWILERAAVAAERGATDIHDGCNSRRSDISPMWVAKTDLGQTCIDLFFRTSLCPLPWQRHSLKERARRIRWAMETVCACPRRMSDLREKLDRQEERYCGCQGDQDPRCGLHDNENVGNAVGATQEDDPVSLVLEFWKKLQLLLCTASGRYENQIDETRSYKSNEKYGDFTERHPFESSMISHGRTISVLHLLSSLSWCPEIVGRLVLQLFPGHAQFISPFGGCSGDSAFQTASISSSGSLPLHLWARTQSWRHCHGGSCGSGGNAGTSSSVTADDEHDGQDDPGILRLLCRAYPAAAGIPDPNNYGRLPLHAALVLGKPWDDSARIIFEANPDAVMEHDPYTSLPCFCLPALEAVTVEEQEEMAKQQNRRLSLCWSYISARDKTTALQRASALIDCQRLTTIYQVLRQHPLAVHGLSVADDVA